MRARVKFITIITFFILQAPPLPGPATVHNNNIYVCTPASSIGDVSTLCVSRRCVYLHNNNNSNNNNNNIL